MGADNLRVVEDLLARLATGRDTSQTLSKIAHVAAACCRPAVAVISAFRYGQDSLEIVAIRGCCKTAVGKSLPTARFLSGLVASTRRPIARADVSSAPRLRVCESAGEGGLRGVAVVPLRSALGVFGSLAVASARPWFPDELQCKLVRMLADCASVALQWRPPGDASSRCQQLLGDAQPQILDGSIRAGEGLGSHITRRQLEISRLLVTGATSKEIGKRLGISSRTVEHHLERLKVRFRQSTVHGLVGQLLLFSKPEDAALVCDPAQRA